MNQLAQALTQARNLLWEISHNPSLPTILATAFGEDYNFTEADNFFARWRNQDFSNLPEIQILPSSILHNAQGGYSTSTNRIYLSSTLLEEKSPSVIRNVLLEEIGHFIDAHINSTDTPGDEGAIFSALLQGKTLTENQLSHLRAEDDTVTINIDGAPVEIEQSEQSINFIGQWRGTFGTVKVVGDRAFLLTSSLSYQGGYRPELVILDVSNPAAPSLLGSYQISKAPRDLEIVGDRVFLATRDLNDVGSTLFILDVSNPAAPSLLGSYQNSGRTGDVEIVGARAFLASGDRGLEILDISNVAAPSLLASYKTKREYAFTVAVEIVGNRAFLEEAGGRLVILDISNPAAPSLLGSYQTSRYRSLSHLKIVGNRAFGVDNAGKLAILDVSNPAAPSLLSSYQTRSYIADIEIVGNRAFLANGYNGVEILDVSIGVVPSLLGSYQTSRYAEDIEIVGDRAFLADSRGGGLVIFDVPNFVAPSTTLTLQFSQAAYHVNEDGSLVGSAVTITRTGNTDSTATVTLNLRDGTAISPADYDNSPITVNFAVGEIHQTVTIPIVNDTHLESDETVNLTLANPSKGYSLGRQSTATLTIIDDETRIPDYVVWDGVNNIINGNKWNNFIKGLGGDDTIKGHRGNDTLDGGSGNDVLKGGPGADRMVGGTGNDTYHVDHVRDVVIEFENEGNDTIISNVNYTLPNHVENLKLRKDAISGTGNSLDNRIVGNIYNNILMGIAGNNLLNGNGGNDLLTGGVGKDVLRGGSGDDTLIGGAGRDRLFGGSGNDVFDYQDLTDSLLSTGFDSIPDFNANYDKFLVSVVPTVFTDLGSVVRLTESAIARLLTEDNFGNIGDVAQFSFRHRTFIAINDDTPGFQANSDAMIDVTGLVGTLNLSNFITT